MTSALKLLELQRHAMLMYASCGWFFDELSGIETVQTMFFAGRAVQLSQDLSGILLRRQLLNGWALAKGNFLNTGKGRRSHENSFGPPMWNWSQAAAPIPPPA